MQGYCYTYSMNTDFFTSPLAIALYVSLAINLSMFLVAFWRQSDKLTDISYAVTFATIAIWGFTFSEQNSYHLLLLAMVLLWALRLGGFLLYRVIQKGKDARFDEMRGSFWKFGQFWLAQAVTVWVVMIPAILAFEASIELSYLLITGLAVWAIGVVCESIADFQKLAFSNDPSNKDKWIETGIWKYSRHPNYFGEILVWSGLYLFVELSLTPLNAFIGLVSPAFIIVLLLFVSGIPILEKAADKRWGKDPAYQRYKKRTSILVPLPRR